ncbi:response regulator [Planctomycetota bacterium]
MESSPRNTVLVVDDDKVQRELLKRVLGLFQLNVQLAPTGADALQMLKESVPDLVLLDIQMPGMDGYETLRQIQNLLQQDAPPVVGLSGSLERGDEGEKGFSDYIVKPFNISELRDLLRPFVDLPPS